MISDRHSGQLDEWLDANHCVKRKKNEDTVSVRTTQSRREQGPSRPAVNYSYVDYG